MVAKPFTNKVFIVSGGSSGIGAAITQTLIQRGAQVVVGQRSESDSGHFIQTDLSKPEACQRLIKSTYDTFGQLDGLVNNAGMMFERSIQDTSLEDWNLNLSINLTAPFLLIKYALPYLIQTSGSIVNIGSIEGLGANPLHSAYCASKGGLHALTRAVAIDHGIDNIRCNAIAPGWIDTDLNNDFIESMPNPAAFKQNLKTIHPLGRTGTPEDIANLTCWLLSDESNFVTGQVWAVDGGRMAKLSLPSL